MGYTEIYERLIEELGKFPKNESVVIKTSCFEIMRVVGCGMKSESYTTSQIRRINKLKKSLSIFVKYTGIGGFGSFKMKVPELRCQGMADRAIENGAKIIKI